MIWNLEDIGPPAYCHHCHGEIYEERWFARMCVGGQRVVFCRPKCVEHFLQARREGRGTVVPPPVEPAWRSWFEPWPEPIGHGPFDFLFLQSAA